MKEIHILIFKVFVDKVNQVGLLHLAVGRDSHRGEGLRGSNKQNVSSLYRVCHGFRKTK